MNQTEFKIAMLKSGVNSEKLAVSLGLNICTIYRKINGETDFTLSELRQLKTILNLSSDDVDTIFFAETLTKTQENN